MQDVTQDLIKKLLRLFNRLQWKKYWLVNNMIAMKHTAQKQNTLKTDSNIVHLVRWKAIFANILGLIPAN